MKRILVRCAYLAAALLVPAFAVSAQNYPSKPVHIVVPYSPGGPADTSARIVANSLQEHFGQTFIVENRPGAGGTVGVGYVARSAPDGYTLVLSNIADTWKKFLEKSLPYDFVRDFEPVSELMSSNFMVVGNPKLPVNTIQDLIQLAKDKPGTLTYGSSGFGVSSHLGGELLSQLADVDIRHVPYKGQSPAMSDLLGGHIAFMFANPVTAIPHIKAGTLRALATTGLERDPPGDIPTVAESGVPGFEVNTWFGISAPAGTPPEVINTLSKGIVKALKDPRIRKEMEAMGAVPVGSTPEEFRKLIQSDMEKWEKVISKITIQK